MLTAYLIERWVQCENGENGENLQRGKKGRRYLRGPKHRPDLRSEGYVLWCAGSACSLRRLRPFLYRLQPGQPKDAKG